VTKFSFTGSLNPLKVFNADLAGGVFILGNMAEALGTAGKAFTDFVQGPAEAARAMRTLAFNAGVASHKIREMEYVSQQLGASQGDATSAITSLSDKIAQAGITGDANFARLGISVRTATGELKTADTVLGEVRMRFKQMGLSVQQQKPLAEGLGINQNLLRFLNASNEEVEKLTRKSRALNYITEQQEKTSEAYSNATRSTKLALSGLQAQIAIGLTPALTRSSRAFSKFIQEHKPGIIEFGKKAAEWIGTIGESINRLAPILKVVGGAFVGFLVLTTPISATAAAIALAVLAVDDLIVAFKGGRSVIRDFFLEFLGWDIRPALQDMAKAFNVFFEKLRQMWNELDLVKMFEQFKQLTDVSGFVYKALEFRDKADKAFFDSTDFSGVLFDVLGGSGSSNTSDNRQVTQNNTVNVYGSDAQSTANATVDGLARNLRDANSQIVKGGL
jgi:hypothetical protein